jgi:hypothetical protein
MDVEAIELFYRLHDDDLINYAIYKTVVCRMTSPDTTSRVTEFDRRIFFSMVPNLLVAHTL